MSISSIGSQIVSKLGSPDSRIPLAAKDLFNCAGYTYFSYDAGGKVEGKDRLVDELGTGSIWLFGIPAYKKLIDKTIFKKSGISPEVDVRIVKNKEYLKKAIENAPDKTILKEITNAGKNLNKVRGLTWLKFALSLGLTLASYFMLTKFKHNMTKKNIEKDFLEKQVLEEDNKYKNLLTVNNSKFKDFNIPKSNVPSFGSSAFIKGAEDFIFNPIKNMFLLDIGISSERLTGARTKGEFQEYAIKEGSFLFFVYGAGKLISKGINKAAELIKCPIDLDAKVISDNLAKDILNKKDIQNEIKQFTTQFTKDSKPEEIIDFIFKNQNNSVVEAAKKSGLISTIKTKEGKIKIDTRKYIDSDKIKKLAKDLESFIKASEKSTNKSAFLNKIKALKVGATILNVAICCFALGYLVPKKMYELRQKNQNGNNDFHVKTEYEKELKEKQASGTLKQ